MDVVASFPAYDFGGKPVVAAVCPALGDHSPQYSHPPQHSQSPQYSDRFIPSRNASDFSSGFDRLENDPYRSAAADIKDTTAAAYSHLLRSEVLGVAGAATADQNDGGNVAAEGGSLFRYKCSAEAATADAFSSSAVPFRKRDFFPPPRKVPRKIASQPFKVLDAPALQDDFYLNLLDWSSANVLAVGLANCVYLWSAHTSEVTKLCDLGEDDMITSVGWTQRGHHLAVGTNSGAVQIWDHAQCRKLRTMGGHSERVGSMAWNGYVLSTGSRDRSILHRDVREASHSIAKLTEHRHEVCGLKWSWDGQQLASGGNDNKLFVWGMRSCRPELKFTEHEAAVKAIAWSPHQRGLLASGGGTADRNIRFWNTVNSTRLSRVDTGSQVCNLAWSKSVNEIVSTHGYSLNQVVVWKYPSMTEVATLTGHTYRVVYLAMSPDGRNIVTGAGDETLRFWSVFPGTRPTSGAGLSPATLPVGHTIR